MEFNSSLLSDKLKKIREDAEERDAERLAYEKNLEYLDANSAPIKVDALKLVSEDLAKKNNATVIESKGSSLALVAIDPLSDGVKGLIKDLQAKGYSVKTFIVSRRGLERVMSFYKFTQEKTQITSRVNIEKDRIIFLMGELSGFQKLSKFILDFDYKSAPIAEFLEIIISGALSNRVSDIHFEPEEDFVKLRYRIDGILHDIATQINRDFYKSVVSRIKLLSNLKINVSDRTQDGRFTIGLTNKDIELRVAIAPSEFGEIIVMRVLDPDSIKITMPQLGLRKDDLEIVQTELRRPNGMILNTGPTGSGKTTTLYAFLRYKSSTEIKIITVEDPIEYHLEGIEQTQVNDEAGYTFANGLRSIMRQDPDVILVGEVRDKETAEIALQAALTGHLVFSTIHANEAAGAIPRLIDLEVKPQSIGPAINLIIAQRLIRKLCESCKIESVVSEDLKIKIDKLLAKLPKRVDRNDYKNIKIFEKKGCEKCANSGFKGRLGIYEMLLNDPGYENLSVDPNQNLSSHQDLEELIKKQAGEGEIRRFALDSGMVTMQEDGILKIISGITSFSEVEDTTGPIKWQP